MFITDHWYVATFAGSVTHAKPLARTICGKPVVIYRTAAGAAVALEDRCIHRGAPLSYGGGECEGENIRCPYHGLEFGPTGQCVKIPGQTQIPAGARVLRYELVERDALLWIWSGDPSKADPSLIPPHPHHVDPKWAWTPISIEIAADWQLLIDNLLDLTHLGFVHRETIGGDPDTHSNAIMRTTRTERGVKVIRWMPNSAPPPHYRNAGQFTGNIDRWQEIDFVPGLIRLWSGGMDVGTGAYEGKREGGVQFMGLHAITPSTATRCYYYFSQSRNFGLGNAALEEKLHQGALATLLEDKAIIEAQQQRRLETPDRPFIDIQSDAGGLQARRIIRRIIDEQLQSQVRTAT
ncbi:MAG: aromatic ring-hydroxylating dioxygenase subunit alpha [Steroidobacteraceae bacterium]